MHKSFLTSFFIFSFICQPVFAFDIGDAGERAGYHIRRFSDRHLTKVLVGTLLALVGYKAFKFGKQKWDEHTNTKALETIKKITCKYEQAFATAASIGNLSETEQLKSWSAIILNTDPQDTMFHGYIKSIKNNIKKLETIIRSVPSQYGETKQQAQKLNAELRQLEHVINRFTIYLQATDCLNHIQKAFEQTANHILTAANQQQQEQNLHQAVRKNRLFNDSKFKYINFEVALNTYIAQLYAFSKLSLNDNLQCFAPVQQNINTLLGKLNDVLALLLSTHEYLEQHTLYLEEQERQALIRHQQQLIEEQNKRMEDLQFALYQEIHRQNMRRYNY